MRNIVDDMSGRRFGKDGVLLVLERAENDKFGNAMWLVFCDPELDGCGKNKIMAGGNLRSGRLKSCGCHQTDGKHGMSRKGQRTPEYAVWQAMIQRCTNENASEYFRYGGRGVRVCEGFSDSSTFLSDVGLRPSPTHSIDRIKNDGPLRHYSCGHCDECIKNGWIKNVRWATKGEQNRNRRNTVMLQHPDGRMMCQKDLAKELGVHDTSLLRMLRKMTLDEAIQKIRKRLGTEVRNP
jgi:hypothetical protein